MSQQRDLNPTITPKRKENVSSAFLTSPHLTQRQPNLPACIAVNTTNGVYGPYSMCNSTQKLGIVLDAYYKDQKSDKTACDFKGKAKLVSAAGAASSCSAGLQSASSAAGVAATATAGTPSNGNSGSSKSSNIAAPIPMKNLFTVAARAWRRSLGNWR